MALKKDDPASSGGKKTGLDDIVKSKISSTSITPDKNKVKATEVVDDGKFENLPVRMKASDKKLFSDYCNNDLGIAPSTQVRQMIFEFMRSVGLKE